MAKTINSTSSNSSPMKMGGGSISLRKRLPVAIAIVLLPDLSFNSDAKCNGPATGKMGALK